MPRRCAERSRVAQPGGAASRRRADRVSRMTRDRALVARGSARGAHHRAEVHEREQPVASAQRRRDRDRRGLGLGGRRAVRRAHVRRRAGCSPRCRSRRRRRPGPRPRPRCSARRRAASRRSSGQPFASIRRPSPRANARGADSRAGPTPRSTARRARGGGGGGRRELLHERVEDAATTRGACVWWSITSDTRIEPPIARQAPRKVVPARGRVPTREQPRSRLDGRRGASMTAADATPTVNTMRIAAAAICVPLARVLRLDDADVVGIDHVHRRRRW